jgi:hypothetical protein
VVEGAHRTFLNVTSDKAESATLHIPAPTAGAKSRLRLNLCQLPTAPTKCEVLLTTAESNDLRVAAKYSVRLSDINALAIASPHSDTLWVGLDAVLRGKLCTPSTCKQNAPDPTHWPNNIYSPADSALGSHYPAFMFVGPFTLVPQSDPDIIVSFAVLNFGSDYSTATRSALVTRIGSNLGVALLLGPPPSGTGFDLMSRLLLRSSNPPKWSGCDGPLAADWLSLITMAAPMTLRQRLAAAAHSNHLRRKWFTREWHKAETAGSRGTG